MLLFGCSVCMVHECNNTQRTHGNYMVCDGPMFTLGTCLHVLNVETPKGSASRLTERLAIIAPALFQCRTAAPPSWELAGGAEFPLKGGNGKIKTSIKYCMHPKPAWNLPTYTHDFSPSSTPTSYPKLPPPPSPHTHTHTTPCIPNKKSCSICSAHVCALADYSVILSE